MLNINRRHLLVASATSLLSCTTSAFAAAPYTLKHGAFELTILSDGHLVLPVAFLAPDAPPAERMLLLQAAGQTEERYNSPTNVTLIRTPTEFILVDMGSGDRFMPTAGKLWTVMVVLAGKLPSGQNSLRSGINGSSSRGSVR